MTERYTQVFWRLQGSERKQTALRKLASTCAKRPLKQDQYTGISRATFPNVIGQRRRAAAGLRL